MVPSGAPEANVPSVIGSMLEAFAAIGVELAGFGTLVLTGKTALVPLTRHE